MEHRLFDPANPPEWLDPEWWRDRPHCDHLGSPTGAHVARLHAAAKLAIRAAGPVLGLGTIVNPIIDLGAGDGALLELIGRRPHAWGYDVIAADLEYARMVRDVEVHDRNVQVAINAPQRPDGLHLGALELGSSVVVLTEVLEHMADPHGFLAKLHARPEVRYVVASSPHSETPERHEWNHAWCWDVDGYQEMFWGAHFRPIETEIVEWSQLWLFEAVRGGIAETGTYGNGECFDHAEEL